MESESKTDKLLSKLAWGFSFFCVVGSICNVYKLWYSFLIWSICNVYFIFHNFMRKEYAQGTLFVVYLFISIWGLISWLEWFN